ncbi:unnamed protein product [Tuwongella immobilis]|uniref:Uncharacterized protein n=1 Tax=Tuwongella immobilis TaxID=692036 RepID=A0A6C2YQN2_9BACT|nr:unnamed protein product [Tuwongella immobilis]VTS04198.1 unnamed protein product [Tuwongella immobilis]
MFLWMSEIESVPGNLQSPVGFRASNLQREPKQTGCQSGSIATILFAGLEFMRIQLGDPITIGEPL